MNTVVAIKNLRVETRIGICDWEQLVDQALFFDIEMSLAVCKAMETDSIADALDYAAVAADVETAVKASDAKLLESLLGELARMLFNNYAQVGELTLAVRKPQALSGADAACLQLAATRSDFQL